MYVFPTPSEGVNFILRIRAAALRTAILPVFHLRTPSKGVPQMYVFPTPSEGVNFANPRHSTPYGHSVLIPPPNSFQRSAANVRFPYSFRRSERWNENAGKRLTFGRWAWCGGRGNAATGGSRGGGVSAHLRKVGRKCGETAHLRKVGTVWRMGKCCCRRFSLR